MYEVSNEFINFNFYCNFLIIEIFIQTRIKIRNSIYID